MRNDSVAVYIITFGNMVKVGISSDPFGRLATLQTACPEPLSIVYLAFFPARSTARKIELAVHRRLASRRREGEWFCIDAEAAVEATERTVRASRPRRFRHLPEIVMPIEEALHLVDAGLLGDRLRASTGPQFSTEM